MQKRESDVFTEISRQRKVVDGMMQEGQIDPYVLVTWYDLLIKGEISVSASLAVIEDPDPDVLSLPVSKLDPSVRVSKTLSRLSVKTLGDLVQISRDKLCEQRNFGIASVNEIEEKLAAYGLKLGMNLPQQRV